MNYASIISKTSGIIAKCQLQEAIRVVEQPVIIPDPGFEKFRIIFHDRIRGGARQSWNFGSTNLNRYTLKTKFFIALHVTNLPLIQHPLKSCTYTTMVILKRNCKDVDINVRQSVSLCLLSPQLSTS